MSATKQVALAKAENGNLDAWGALEALPPDARQIMSILAKNHEDVALRVLALVAGAPMGKGGEKARLPFYLAYAIADHEARSGERYYRDFWWDPAIGYIQATERMLDEATKNIGAVSYEFKTPTDAEIAANDLNVSGDHADMVLAVEFVVQRDRTAAVEAYRAEMGAWREAISAKREWAAALDAKLQAADLPEQPVLQYQPVRGLGIVLAEQMYDGVYIKTLVDGKYGKYEKTTGKNPPEKWGKRKDVDFTNWSWEKKCENRAVRAALRRIPGALRQDELGPKIGEGVTFDLPGTTIVSRKQLIEAEEAEMRRLEAANEIESMPEDAKAKVLDTMRKGAYGPPPEPKPEPAGVLTETEEPETDLLPAIDVAAAIERIRADAKTRDGGEAHKPSAAQLASAWEKLRLLDWDEADLAALVHAIFDADEFTTRGQAAATFYWLRQEGDKTIINPTALNEATAILNESRQTVETEDDNPEDNDDQ
jgi:hypothetical protein